MTQKKTTCPRRVEVGRMADGEDVYERRGDHDFGSCSWCGSMDPDDFMQMVRDGKAHVGPTDKNYKAYVLTPSGGHMGKFYYQHLSLDQRKEFIDLLNEKRVGISYPFHLYVLPFFAQRVATEESKTEG